MNILEGEYDPVMLAMNIITIIIVISALYFLSPHINNIIAQGVCHCP